MRTQIFEVGKIVNTHALGGVLKVTPWTDNADDFERFGYVYVGAASDDNKRKIESVKYMKSGILLTLEGVDSIEAAEKLKTKILYADREQLGEPETGYYICDLIGVRVVADTGEELGKISDVIATGSNDVYVVSKPGARDLLLPVIPDVVLSVDIDEELAHVHLIEGLVD